ncbi:Mediator of RNA polymerase II transcription subunit 28, partial [Glycine soja]
VFKTNPKTPTYRLLALLHLQSSLTRAIFSVATTPRPRYWRIFVNPIFLPWQAEKRNMGDRQVVDQQHMGDPQLPSSPPSKDDMVSCVMALEAALLPCLPARELQAIDRSPHPSHQIDVDRYARDFMEAAKKLQLYFISLQREDKPTKVEMLRKEIALMEEELNIKNELIKKQENLIQEWKKELKDQLDKHKIELDRV